MLPSPANSNPTISTCAEPDTAARISGWRELNTPQGYTDLINDSTLQRLSYTDLMTRMNQRAAQNLVANKPTLTGECFKRLSAGAR